MPHVSQMIQSKFLSKADLPQPVVVSIKGVQLENFKDGDAAWLLFFNELPKALKLNNTTIRTLEAGFGPNTDAWIGKRVRVFVDPTVTMAGQLVGGIRVKTPSIAAVNLTHGAVAPSAQPRFDPMTGLPLPLTYGQNMPVAPAASGVDPDFDDEIPF